MTNGIIIISVTNIFIKLIDRDKYMKNSMFVKICGRN